MDILVLFSKGMLINYSGKHENTITLQTKAQPGKKSQTLIWHALYVCLVKVVVFQGQQEFTQENNISYFPSLSHSSIVLLIIRTV